MQPNDEETKKVLASLHGMQSVLGQDSGRKGFGIPGWIFQATVAAGVLVGLWFYFAPARTEYARFRHHEGESARQAATLATAQRENISELAKRYAAIADWRSHLGNRTAFDTVYSAELAAVLASPERHPALFITKLNDVGQTDGNYVLLLEGLVNFRTHFLLQLSCSGEQANRIMSAPRGEEDRFAVVVAITSVDPGAGTIAADDGASSPNHQTIRVSGDLVDFQFLGTYHGDLLEILSTFKKP